MSFNQSLNHHLTFLEKKWVLKFLNIYNPTKIFFLLSQFVVELEKHQHFILALVIY